MDLAEAEVMGKSMQPRGCVGPSLVSLGVVLFLLTLGVWWAQDLVATVINVGEADTGDVVTFTSDGGEYRLVSSGPLRPIPEATYCDFTFSDGSTDRRVGGSGLQATRLGVDRLMTFTAPEGTTEVTCSERGTGNGSGRFNVVATDTWVNLLLYGTMTAAIVSLLAGIAIWVIQMGATRRDLVASGFGSAFDTSGITGPPAGEPGPPVLGAGPEDDEPPPPA